MHVKIIEFSVLKEWESKKKKKKLVVIQILSNQKYISFLMSSDQNHLNKTKIAGQISNREEKQLEG